MFNVELSGLMCAFNGYVWWVLGTLPGWWDVSRGSTALPVKNIAVLHKIDGVMRLKRKIEEARAEGSYVTGSLHGQEVQVLK